MMVSTARAVLCLCVWLSACPVQGSHVSARMNRTIQNLLLHYKIPPKDRFNGKPVFSREPLAGKVETKKLFMVGVLETYEKLIGQMLTHLPTPNPPTTGIHVRLGAATAAATAPGAGGEVGKELNFILKKVQELRKHRYQEQSELLQGLEALGKIQMDNFVVQSKALWELPWLYEEASSISNDAKMQRRRRRRQTRKLKTPPSA
ncbi:interferon gamma [Scophthalmus maximus]|nr:interferon gamma [Scophthalmus maximus]